MSTYARFCVLCALYRVWATSRLRVLLVFACFCATSNYGTIEKLKLCGTRTKEIWIMNFIVLCPTWQSKPVWKKARTIWHSNYEHSNYPKSTCITNTQVGISGETDPGGGNLHIYYVQKWHLADGSNIWVCHTTLLPHQGALASTDNFWYSEYFYD